jgi:hypothetical protein
MSIGGAHVHDVPDLPGTGVQLDDNAAVLTNTIKLASRPPTHPMWSQKRSDAEVADMPP